MKKFLALLFAAILLTGCANEDNDKIKVGTIKYLNLAEEYLNHDVTGIERQYVFYPNLSNMIMALQAGQIEEMSTYESVAKYFVEQNPDYEWTLREPVLNDSFCFAMREEDDALKREFDEAILKMSKDGTLVKLVKKYIADIQSDVIAKAVDMPEFYNDEMIKIGVTGDLPLLDYIRPDGLPAGFNTAVLAEISQRLKKNFVLVQIESGERALALTSKKIDVIFWVAMPANESSLPSDFDKPAGMILTAPYFSDSIVHVKLRK